MDNNCTNLVSLPFIIELYRKWGNALKKENQTLLDSKDEGELSIPVFGHELIREILLNDLLGPNSRQVLYWAGKRMARKFPLGSMNEIIEFFSSAGWGNLESVKSIKNEYSLMLSGEMVERRFAIDSDCHFQLEAGFLAEQISLQKGFSAEALEEPKRRAGRVSFLVKLDLKDPIQ